MVSLFYFWVGRATAAQRDVAPWLLAFGVQIPPDPRADK